MLQQLGKCSHCRFWGAGQRGRELGAAEHCRGVLRAQGLSEDSQRCSGSPGRLLTAPVELRKEALCAKHRCINDCGFLLNWKD